MKILFVAYYNPLGKGGFEKQARGLFRTLKAQGHQIACLCVNTSGNTQDFISCLESCNIFNLGVYAIEHQENSYSLKAKIFFWLSKNPALYLASQFAQLQSHFQDKFTSIKRDIQPDIIHCLGLRTAYYLPVERSIPTIIDLVDSKTQYKKRAIYYQRKNNFKQYIYSIFDYYKTLKIERDILLNYTEFPVTVVSKKDAEVIKKISPNSLVSTVCHPVAIEDKIAEQNFQLKKGNQEQPKLVFYGFMDYVNLDALLFLAKEIFPLVKQQFPAIKLMITGYNLPQKVNVLASQESSIEIVKNVGNISQFLSQATLTCWAFRYGSGVKNKILESMYLGKPVVTTNIGAEAFNESQKRGMLIADKPEELANYIIDLLYNPEECQRLGTINQQIIATDFTWEKKAQDYLNLYQIARQKKIEDRPLVTTI